MSGFHCGCTGLPGWGLALGAVVYVTAEAVIGSLVKREKVPFGSIAGAVVFATGLLLWKLRGSPGPKGGDKT